MKAKMKAQLWANKEFTPDPKSNTEPSSKSKSTHRRHPSEAKMPILKSRALRETLRDLNEQKNHLENVIQHLTVQLNQVLAEEANNDIMKKRKL